MNSNRLGIYVSAILIAISLFACQKENHPPVIQSMTAEPDSVFPGDTVSISFMYQDDDHDQIFRTISCEIGELFPSDPDGRPIFPINWIAPKQVGKFWFWLDINDGEIYIRDSLFVVIKDTMGAFTDQRDNHEYKWVKIGNQIWMAENLAYLPAVSKPNNGSLTSPHYYVYDYDGEDPAGGIISENYLEYGVLYNFNAAKTACSEGWHLSSDIEWQELEYFLGMPLDEVNTDGVREGGQVGRKIKSTTGWGNNGNGDGLSGFNAKPGGYKDSNGQFSYLRNKGHFWTPSAEHTFDDLTGFRYLKYNTVMINRGLHKKSRGHSVRCVKD